VCVRARAGVRVCACAGVCVCVGGGVWQGQYYLYLYSHEVNVLGLYFQASVGGRCRSRIGPALAKVSQEDLRWYHITNSLTNRQHATVFFFSIHILCNFYYIILYYIITNKFTINIITVYTGLFISPWNMLENWFLPQLNEDSNDYIFLQDGSRAHYKDVGAYLNRNLPQSWLGRIGKEVDALMQWPPRCPDLTSFDFFFWGFVKDTVFVPPLRANLQIFATVSPLMWLC